MQFYANGTFQNAVGNILKISQPSVSRCIHAVSYELTRISRQFINFPENLVPIKRGFYDVSRNLPDFDDEIPDNDQPVNIPHEEIPLNETAAQEKIRLRRLGFLKRDTITANMFQ